MLHKVQITNFLKMVYNIQNAKLTKDAVFQIVILCQIMYFTMFPILSNIERNIGH
jgi:hypothetical protein